MTGRPGNSRAWAALVTTASLALSACQGGDDPGATTTASPMFLPRAIVELRALNAADVYFRLTIDDVALPDRHDVRGASTTVSLDPDRLAGSDVSRIGVSFFLDSGDGIELLLAEGEQDVSIADGERSVTLSALFYRYEDSDGDGLFDVHELAEPPVDLDGDNLLAHEDADSDADGSPDGSDPTPYGENADGAGSPAIELTIEPEGGSREALPIERIAVDERVLRTLAANDAVIEVRTPPGWPLAAVPANLGARSWTAVELNDSLCPPDSEFSRIPIDTGSFESSLSDVALLYFRRGPEGSDGFMAPIGGDTVSDLDAFENVGLRGEGPWNDSLRVLLVPRGVTGWIRLWTETDLGGDACELNLTTPVAIGG